MNVGLHHRSVDPQLRTVLQSELDRRPNHQVVDCFQRLWRQTDGAACGRAPGRPGRRAPPTRLISRSIESGVNSRRLCFADLRTHLWSKRDSRQRVRDTVVPGPRLPGSGSSTCSGGRMTSKSAVTSFVAFVAGRRDAAVLVDELKTATLPFRSNVSPLSATHTEIGRKHHLTYRAVGY
jgi:hypothetical protein